MRKHFRVPPFAKNAKDEAPILLVMPAKSKAWATATRNCGGFCSLKAGPPAPPTLRFPERTGVALRSDLAHDNHQNSNFLFRLH